MNPTNSIITTGEFQQTYSPEEQITENKKMKRTSGAAGETPNIVEAVHEVGSTKPASAIPPAGTHTPVDLEEMGQLEARLSSATPETTARVALAAKAVIPRLTASDVNELPLDTAQFVGQAIQLVGLDPDLSVLRYYRDNIDLMDPAEMATYCLNLEKLSFDQQNAHNRKKLGDYFREMMAASPDFREKMCLCKVVINSTEALQTEDTDIAIPGSQSKEIFTNATTLLNECKILMMIAEDIGIDLLSQDIHLHEDPTYAIPVIRYFETDKECWLDGLDLFELALLASKWGSSRLQTFCKRHVAGMPMQVDEQLIKRVLHLMQLQDNALDYILLPMASQFVMLSKTDEIKPLWDPLTEAIRNKLVELHMRNLVRQASISRRVEHPDRINYSLQLIAYVNACLQKRIPDDLFYVTPLDVQEALRIVFCASLDKAIDPEEAYRVVLDLCERLNDAKVLFCTGKEESFIKGILNGWCCLICNYLKPNLPEDVIDNLAWHGTSIYHAIGDISPEKKNVLNVCDELVKKALTEGIAPGSRRIRWLLRPTTKIASEGVATLCIYDASKNEFMRIRIQCHDGRFSQLREDRTTGELTRRGRSFSALGNLVNALIKGMDNAIRIEDIQCVCKPVTREEREKVYCTNTYVDI